MLMTATEISPKTSPKNSFLDPASPLNQSKNKSTTTMFRRPKASETEEDILRLQEEFLSNKTQTAATLVHRVEKLKATDGEIDLHIPKRDVVQMEGPPSELPKADAPTAPPSKKSRFHTSKGPHRTRHTDDDPEERLERHDTHMAAILCNIIERDTRGFVVPEPTQVSQPFPSVFESGNSMQNSFGASGKKRSLFAEHFARLSSEKMSSNDSDAMEINADSDVSKKDIEHAVPRSHIIEGTGLSATFGEEEAKNIHRENIQVLSQMTKEDILAEQKKLFESLDQNTIAFLKQRKDDIGQIRDPPVPPVYQEFPHKRKKKNVVKQDVLTLPVKPRKEWVHMDKVEDEKLRWMNDLPLPQTGDAKTGQKARFDFQGNLVDGNAEFPVTMGLHHHGDEPERAGYSLDELFQLARSSQVQQRTLALSTLGKVLNMARSGELEGLIQTPIVPAVLDAGVVFLFRWALDDSVDSVVAAAVAAISGLLINYADQKCQDRVLPWFRGYEMCARRPAETTKEILMPKVDEEEQPEETDADIAKRDVIMAFVNRMSLLPRLHYILDVMRPQALTVLQILEILTAVAQHSAQISYQIMQNDKLITLIITEFLPLGWNIEDSGRISRVYGIGLPAAMRLMRTIAQAGRNMAAMLLKPQYRLQATVLQYLADNGNPENLQLPRAEAFELQTETLRFWRICLLYGLATDTFIEMYPILVQALQDLQKHVTEDDPDPLVSRKMVAMVTCMEAGLHVAAKSRNWDSEKDGISFEMETSGEFAIPKLAWSHVADLIHPVLMATQILLQNIQKKYQFKKPDLQLHTACVGFLSTYFSTWPSQPGYNAVDNLEQLEILLDTCLAPLWKSVGFQLILRNLSEYSNLLYKPDMKKTEVAASLPDLGCSMHEGTDLPVTRQASPYGFLTAVLRLAHVCCRIHKGLLEKIETTIVLDEDILSYMKKIAQNKPSHLHSNYFTKYENQFQYFYLKLVTQTKTAGITQHAPVLHSAALVLMQHLLYGDEFMAHDLLSTVLFQGTLWQPEEVVTAGLSKLQVSDTVHLNSATQEQIHFTCSQLLLEAMSNFPAIRATYLKAFAHSERDMYRSRCRFYVEPMKILTFMSSHIGECLMPTDWMFFPLIELYNRISSVRIDQQNRLVSSQTGAVSNILQWIFFLENQRPVIMRSISVTLKISRLMCVFMTGNDLFLERSIHCYLAALLREYSKPALLQQMDFEEDIPGIPAFYDLYTEFLQQYQAVSFGDSLFGCYVLLPLQQKHNLRLRKAVWTEHCGILRTLRIPIQELLIPLGELPGT
ncbi:hypothetical protein ScPMuIL_014504 [Solemya velum]